MYAVQMNQMEAARLLVGKGCDISQKSYGSPLVARTSAKKLARIVSLRFLALAFSLLSRLAPPSHLLYLPPTPSPCPRRRWIDGAAPRCIRRENPTYVCIS